MPSRNTWSRVAFAGSLLLLLLATSRQHLRGGDEHAPTRAALPVTRPALDPRHVSDRAVREAITRGADFLLAQFKDGQITQGSETSPAFHEGLNALCVYALVSAGQATRDTRLVPTSAGMRRMIDEMKFHPMATDRD